MKPRPLTRSITFWSGIFVMLFIGFAWRDSMTHTSFVARPEMHVMSGGALVQVWSIGDPVGDTGWGWPTVRRNPDHKRWPAKPFGTLMLVRGDDFKQEEINRNDRITVTYQDRMSGVAKWGFPRRNWVLFLPHWIVLLAFALLWAGLLLLRSRRLRRASLTETEAPVYLLDPARREDVIAEVAGQGFEVSVQDGEISFRSGNGAAVRLVSTTALSDRLVTIHTTRQGDRGLTDAIESAIFAHGGRLAMEEERA